MGPAQFRVGVREVGNDLFPMGLYRLFNFGRGVARGGASLSRFISFFRVA